MVTKKRVKITETVLRDGHQSIAATRMHTSLNAAGVGSLG